jgi:hypothetical protein
MATIKNIKNAQARTNMLSFANWDGKDKARTLNLDQDIIKNAPTAFAEHFGDKDRVSETDLILNLFAWAVRTVGKDAEELSLGITSFCKQVEEDTDKESDIHAQARAARLAYQKLGRQEQKNAATVWTRARQAAGIIKVGGNNAGPKLTANTVLAWVEKVKNSTLDVETFNALTSMASFIGTLQSPKAPKASKKAAKK